MEGWLSLRKRKMKETVLEDRAHVSSFLPLSICRVCLATNVKMYCINDDRKSYYENVTGLNVSSEEKLPQALCWECSHRLEKCYRFKAQAELTHRLLESLLKTEGTITDENVGEINRCKYGLKSNLARFKREANDYDVCMSEAEVQGDATEAGDTDRTLTTDVVQIKEETNGFIDKQSDSDSVSDASDFENDSSEDCAGDREEATAKQRVKTVINESLFNITNLTFDEQIREIEKRKETDNYKKSEFKCEKCFKGFLYEAAFKFHMTRHTNKSGKFECEVCKVHFKSYRAMKHHASSHWQKIACKQCPYVTGRLHTAKLHEAYHNGAQYKCPHCEEVFCKQTTYMSHLRVKHPSDIVCQLCGNSFISEKGLHLHNKLKHRFDEAAMPQEKHRCEPCGLSFVKEEALQTHLRAKHLIGVPEDGTIRRRDRVSDPERARLNKMKAERYVRKCRPKEPVQCEQCGLQLPDPRAYYCHFRRAHPGENRTSYPWLQRNHPSMCEVCGRIFKCRSLLEDHSNTHAGLAQFKCPQCDKAFLTRYSLAVHSRIHRVHKTVFSCSICQKNFSTKSNLQRHEFSHTGLKPHKCEMCGKCFKYADERRAHLQYVHLSKPYPRRARPKRPPRPPRQAPLSAELGATHADIDV